MVKQYRMRRSVVRTGRSARRKFGKRQMVLKKGYLIHYFKRTFKTSQVVSVGTFIPIESGAAGLYNNFRLSHLPNSTDFTNLYDSYKICGIKQKFIYNKNTADTSGSTMEVPRLITVNDFNDVAALTDENSALEYASFKAVRLDKFAVSRYFRPTQDINRTADSNVDQTVKARWNSTTLNNIDHHGLKAAIIQTNALERGVVDVYTTYYIACRTPR